MQVLAWSADRFVVVTHALEERRTPGNTLIVQPDQPWQACLSVSPSCLCVSCLTGCKMYSFGQDTVVFIL